MNRKQPLKYFMMYLKDIWLPRQSQALWVVAQEHVWPNLSIPHTPHCEFTLTLQVSTFSTNHILKAPTTPWTETHGVGIGGFVQIYLVTSGAETHDAGVDMWLTSTTPTISCAKTHRAGMWGIKMALKTPATLWTETQSVCGGGGGAHHTVNFQPTSCGWHFGAFPSLPTLWVFN